ncbi:hypothetical protein D3C72_1232590 [compost metagenome]
MPRSRVLYSDSDMNNTSELSEGSSSKAVSIFPRMSGRLDICADASTGLPVLAVGTASWMRCCVRRASAGRVIPASLMASAIMMPKPPEAATSVTASLRGSRFGISIDAAWPMSISASTERTRSTPWRRKTASMTASDPVSAPVCEAAACWPFSVEPIFNTMTGLPRWRARRSALISLVASRQVSMQHRMMCVSGSSASAAMPSATSTSASLPVAMKRLTPMPRRATLCMVWLPTLPDCDTMPACPTGGMCSSSAIENEPIRRSATLTAPRQFGPNTRMPCSRAMATSSACSAVPAGPASVNPADSTMAALVPRAAQSRKAAGVALAGTARITSSGAVGVSRTET